MASLASATAAFVSGEVCLPHGIHISVADEVSLSRASPCLSLFFSHESNGAHCSDKLTALYSSNSGKEHWHWVRVGRRVWRCLITNLDLPRTSYFHHSLIHTLTHSPTHSLIHTLTHPLIHTLTHSLIHTFTDSPTHSLTHTLTHSPTHLLTHSHTHSLTHTLTLTHSHTH